MRARAYKVRAISTINLFQGMGASTSTPVQQTRVDYVNMLTVLNDKTEIFYVHHDTASGNWQLTDCKTNIQIGASHMSDIVKILLRRVTGQENIFMMFRFDSFPVPLTTNTDVLGLLFVAKYMLYKRHCPISKTPAKLMEVNVK